ncbi:MAG: hypothetical protein SNJ70_04905 [Armatimonadota bacterium]
MSRRACIKKEFSEVIKKILDNSNVYQAAKKTGISYEYVRRMRDGLVPSEEIIKKFADGMNANFNELRVAAGYAPVDAVEAVREALNTANNLSEKSKMQIMAFVETLVTKKIVHVGNINDNEDGGQQISVCKPENNEPSILENKKSDERDTNAPWAVMKALEKVTNLSEPSKLVCMDFAAFMVAMEDVVKREVPMSEEEFRGQINAFSIKIKEALRSLRGSKISNQPSINANSSLGEIIKKGHQENTHTISSHTSPILKQQNWDNNNF